MTHAEMDRYIREHPIDWPPLSESQRVRLAVLLRPDLPVGIRSASPPPPLPLPEAA